MHWSEVPGRDEKYGKNRLLKILQLQFRVEFECEFLGSVDTLIAPSKLKSMAYDEPCGKGPRGGEIYENPKEDHDYILTVDVVEE